MSTEKNDCWGLYVQLLAKSGYYLSCPVFRFLLQKHPLALLDRLLLLILRSPSLSVKESSAEIATSIIRPILEITPLGLGREILYRECALFFKKFPDSYTIQECGKELMIWLLNLSLDNNESWTEFNESVLLDLKNESLDEAQSIFQIFGHLTPLQRRVWISQIRKSFDGEHFRCLLNMLQEGWIEGLLVMPLICDMLDGDSLLLLTEVSSCCFIAVFGEGFSDSKNECAECLLQSIVLVKHKSPMLIESTVRVINIVYEDEDEDEDGDRITEFSEEELCKCMHFLGMEMPLKGNKEENA